MSHIRLGAYLLDIPLARGGMAEVWRARHHPSETPVAIKMLPRSLDDSHGRRRFESEVRAMAALDHPGIVRVLDYGRVSDATSRDARGRLLTGAPWVAMELATGGSLAQIGTVPDWPSARGVLLAILDALAHAHARQVVHKDIKPGNVLLCGVADLRPGLKLTDFGLASAIGAAPDSPGTAGTLHYMAPEQVRGAWRDVGPWTDLYALGCTAWRLLTGHTVFQGMNGNELKLAQTRQPPPAFRSEVDLPPGFHAWLTCLLAKEPRDRFKRAADAAAALLALDGNPTSVVLPLPSTPVVVADALERLPKLPGEMILSNPTTLVVEISGHGDAAERTLWRPVSLAEDLDYSGRRVPPTWRHPLPRSAPLDLGGAGLGVLPLRESRLVGREAERDHLWSVLSTVAETGQPNVVLLRGPAGLGKSRLAVWLQRRGHELGVSETFGVQLMQGSTGESGLRSLVQSALTTEGLARPEVEVVAESVLGRGRDSAVLADLLHPLSDQDLQAGWEPVGEVTEGERFEVVTRLLERLSQPRLGLVLLDDVHWSLGAIRWISSVLDRPATKRGRLLFLLTVQDEDAVVDSRVARALTRLRERRRVHSLDITPLEPGEIDRLVRERVGMEASSSAMLVHRAHGSPQVVTSLTSQWAIQGRLVKEDHGFRVTGLKADSAPAEELLTWLQRARRALEPLTVDAWIEVERAAALGMEVDEECWEAVGASDTELRQEVEDALLRTRLATPTRTGWRFVSGALRDALLEEAKRSSRLVPHHLACVEGLRGLDVLRYAVDIGRHLLMADQLEEAVDLLLKQSTEWRAQSSVLRILSMAEQAMREAGIPFRDPRWGETWALRARLCIRSGRYDEGHLWATRAREAAMEHGWPLVETRAAIDLAVVALHRRTGDGAELAARALQLAEQAQDDNLHATASYVWAASTMEARQFDLARSQYELAMQRYSVLGNAVGRADCLRDLGNLALWTGDLDEAERCYTQAVQLIETEHSVMGRAHALNGLAEVKRKRGDLPGAEEGYRRALELFERIGAGQATLARLNLGLVLLAQKDWAAALGTLEGARDWLRDQGRDTWLGASLATMLPAYAGLEDWVSFDRAAAQAYDLLNQTGFAQPDILHQVECAWEMAREAGQVGCAEAAGRIVEHQTSLLGQS